MIDSLKLTYHASPTTQGVVEFEGRQVGYQVDKDTNPNTIRVWADGDTFITPLTNLVSLHCTYSRGAEGQ